MSPGTAEPAKTVNILLQLVGAADLAPDAAAGAAFSAEMGKIASAPPLAIDLRDGADADAPLQDEIVLERSDAGKIVDPFPLTVLFTAPPAEAPTIAPPSTIAPPPMGAPEISAATPPKIGQTVERARAEPPARQRETPGAPPLAFPIDETQSEAPPAQRPQASPAKPPIPAPDIAPVAPVAAERASVTPAAEARQTPPPQDAVAITAGSSAPEFAAAPDAAPPAPAPTNDVVAAAPIAARHDHILKAAAPAASDPAPRTISIVTSSVARDGTIEVRLDPPELGRVAIDFSTDANGAARAVVIVDRAETLDLVRRHIDIFKEELARQGFGDVDMTFRERGRDEGDAPPAPPKKWKHLAEAGFDLDAAMSGAMAAGHFDVVA